MLRKSTDEDISNEELETLLKTSPFLLIWLYKWLQNIKSLFLIKWKDLVFPYSTKPF